MDLLIDLLVIPAAIGCFFAILYQYIEKKRNGK